MSLEVTQRFVYESVAQQIPKLFVVYLRAVIPKKFDQKKLYAQFPNSHNLHLYHLQIFPLRENSLYECKIFSPLFCFYARSSLVIRVRYHEDIFIP